MNYIIKLTKGYIISIVLFLLLTVPIVILVKFTSISEGSAVYFLLGALALATLFLGIFSGKLIGQKGLLSGLLLSTILVFLVIFGINCAYLRGLSPQCFDTLYLIPIIIGGIGGIIGVNVKK